MFQQVSNLIKKIHPCRYQLSFLCLISQTGKLDFHVTSTASFDMHVTAVCGHRAEPTGTGSTKHAHSTLAGLWHRSGSARALTKQWEGIRKPLHAESHWNSQRTANSEQQPGQGKAGQGRAGPRTDASPSFSTGGGGDGRRMRGAALAAGRDGGAAGGPELQVGGGAGRPGGGGADAFRRFSPVLVLVAAAVAASAPELTCFGAVSALAARGVAGGGRSRAARREPPVEPPEMSVGVGRAASGWAGHGRAAGLAATLTCLVPPRRRPPSGSP